LLAEYGMPATVYLTTYYCLNQLPVFDTMCRYILWKARKDAVDVSGILPGLGSLSTDTADARHQAFLTIRRSVDERGLPATDKDAVLSAIAGRSEIDYAGLRAARRLSLMSPSDVSGLDPGLIDVQLHTHRHRVPLDRTRFLREIADNRAALAGLRPGPRADHFCYPSGVTHPAFLPWLRDAGVVSATTCVSGLTRRGSDALLLPRLLDAGNVSVEEYDAWLTGVAALLPRRSEHYAAPA
jgi:peptidoglycan/xylan/chitin deacetylase (PgdA/CDA1 family)